MLQSTPLKPVSHWQEPFTQAPRPRQLWMQQREDDSPHVQCTSRRAHALSIAASRVRSLHMAVFGHDMLRACAHACNPGTVQYSTGRCRPADCSVFGPWSAARCIGLESDNIRPKPSTIVLRRQVTNYGSRRLVPY